MKTTFIYFIIVCLGFVAACNGSGQERGTFLTLASTTLNGRCGQAFTPFHTYVNTSGSDQMISITVKATGKCPVVIKTADPKGESRDTTTVAVADTSSSGSGTTRVANGRAVEFGLLCQAVIFDDDKTCRAEVTLHLHR